MTACHVLRFVSGSWPPKHMLTCVVVCGKEPIVERIVHIFVFGETRLLTHDDSIETHKVFPKLLELWQLRTLPTT